MPGILIENKINFVAISIVEFKYLKIDYRFFVFSKSISLCNDRLLLSFEQ